MQLTCGLLLALVAVASARHVVPVKIQKDFESAKVASVRRRAAFDEPLANNLTSGAYFATVEVGTPGQSLVLHVDTGSTDVWVLSTRANLCTSRTLQSMYGPCFDTFDDSKSSTFESLDTVFQITYLDESGASGRYFTDVVHVGDFEVADLQMGLADKSTSQWGMLGIGYARSSAAARVYPSIIDQMHSQGLINIKAYSLYLNDLEASTGTILFGGIDVEKFYGTLKSVPTLPDDDLGHIAHFNVSLTSLSVLSAASSTSNLIPPSEGGSIPVILDSGTTLTYLPRSVTAPLFAALGAHDFSSSSSFSNVYIDCSILTTSPDLVLSYQFAGSSGPVIEVSIADIVFDDLKPLVAAGQLILPSSLPFPADRTCSLGVMTSTPGDVHLLGDTFLRSAYVVYDLSHDRIALAQANLNSTKESIVEIPAGAAGVPLATGTNQPPVRPAPAPTKNAAMPAVGVPRGWYGVDAVVMGCVVGLFTIGGAFVAL